MWSIFRSSKYRKSSNSSPSHLSLKVLHLIYKPRCHIKHYSSNHCSSIQRNSNEDIEIHWKRVQIPLKYDSTNKPSKKGKKAKTQGTKISTLKWIFFAYMAAFTSLYFFLLDSSYLSKVVQFSSFCSRFSFSFYQ